MDLKKVRISMISPLCKTQHFKQSAVLGKTYLRIYCKRERRRHIEDVLLIFGFSSTELVYIHFSREIAIVPK